MGIGVLRNLIRPLARTAVAYRTVSFPAAISGRPASPATEFRSVLGSFQQHSLSWIFQSSEIHSLTDTRFPKRRPGLKSRRKRASLKPPGPYAWVQYTPGEPIPASRPNEGSVKNRNEKKRIKQRKAFIKSEAKKRKTQVQEAKRKKNVKKIERKMAAVAREREWAQRLAELQRLEAEKKSMA